MDVRACRDCGEEYRLDAQVSVCADCGGTIETRHAGADGDDARPAAVAADPQRSYRFLYLGASAFEVQPLARRLGKAGIPFAVRGNANRFEVVVDEARFDDAQKLVGLVFGTGAAPAPEAAAFDPERGYQQCPACNTALPAGAAECPECGLRVASDDEDEDCPRCGVPHVAGAERCTSCG